MKLVSWNVNGIRAIYKKNFLEFIQKENPDIICLQEAKANIEQLKENELNPLGYASVFSSAEKKGYSGVAVYYKKDLDIKIRAKTLGNIEFDSEGRFLVFEVSNFLIYNIYFPSGSSGDHRQDFKYKFLDFVYNHLESISQEDRERLVICGDFNICHKDIDIHHPKEATRFELSGFLPQERAWMDKLQNIDLVDAYRSINGDIQHKYTWWTYRQKAREKNLGWRIDYFFISKTLSKRLKGAEIMNNYLGSDHCPVFIEFA